MEAANRADESRDTQGATMHDRSAAPSVRPILDPGRELVASAAATRQVVVRRVPRTASEAREVLDSEVAAPDRQGADRSGAASGDRHHHQTDHYSDESQSSVRRPFRPAVFARTDDSMDDWMAFRHRAVQKDLDHCRLHHRRDPHRDHEARLVPNELHHPSG
jgi:hypothetical protein